MNNPTTSSSTLLTLMFSYFNPWQALDSPPINGTSQSRVWVIVYAFDTDFRKVSLTKFLPYKNCVESEAMGTNQPVSLSAQKTLNC